MSVSVTVSRPRSNSVRCRSRTPARNSFPNARLSSAADATSLMIGRAAIRSSWFFSTTSSVMRSAIALRAASSSSTAAARLANWSESTSATRA